MKIYTTNYFNTFILVAADCPVLTGEVPPYRGDTKSAANIQYELINNNPYRYTSDAVLFQVFALKNNIEEKDRESAREQFFAKGQACFRTSPLTKRYGWGVHFDGEGRMAIYSFSSAAYEMFALDTSLKVIRAMKSSR